MDLADVDLRDYKRFTGPHRNRPGRWLVYGIRVDGAARDVFTYEAEEVAKRQVQLANRGVGHVSIRSVGKMLDEYERHLRQKGNKPNSVKETIRRLRRFFSDENLLVHRLDEQRCKAYYNRFVEEGKAADTHRNYLAEAKSFGRWCVTQKVISANPLEHIQGVGKRRHGKTQLTIDESRLWMAEAIQRANNGDAGAVAALMTLLLDLRCSEIVTRRVRDVDDGGRLLWVSDSKTEAGKRTMEIPAVLQPFLVGQGIGKADHEYLFPSGKAIGDRYKTAHRDRAWPRIHVHKICAAAGVTDVNAHGMRGLHASVAVEHGVTPHVVAHAMGHESFTTTAESYAKSESIRKARRAKVIRIVASETK